MAMMRNTDCKEGERRLSEMIKHIRLNDELILLCVCVLKCNEK